MTQSPPVVCIGLSLTHSSLPPDPEGVVVPGSETDTPALENDDADSVLASAIDNRPLGLGHPIALPGKSSLVVLRDGGGLACAQRGKDFFAQREIMCRGLAAVLEERVRRMLCCERHLVGMRQVNVVEREGYHGQRVRWSAKGLIEGGDLQCRSGTIDQKKKEKKKSTQQ